MAQKAMRLGKPLHVRQGCALRHAGYFPFLLRFHPSFFFSNGRGVKVDPPQKVLRGGIPCSFLEPFVRFCVEISSKVIKSD